MRWLYLSWQLGHTRLQRMHRTASLMAILPLATKRARRRPYNGPSSLPLETRWSTQTQKLRFSLRKPRGFIKSSSAVDAERPGHSELLHAAYAVVLSTSVFRPMARMPQPLDLGLASRIL